MTHRCDRLIFSHPNLISYTCKHYMSVVGRITNNKITRVNRSNIWAAPILTKQQQYRREVKRKEKNWVCVHVEWWKSIKDIEGRKEKNKLFACWRFRLSGLIYWIRTNLWVPVVSPTAESEMSLSSIIDFQFRKSGNWANERERKR